MYILFYPFIFTYTVRPLGCALADLTKWGWKIFEKILLMS
jgi:hypothetical protein